MKPIKCNYANCRALADVKTRMGCFCKYHQQVMNKKLGNTLETIESYKYTQTQKRLLTKSLNQKNFDVEIKS